MSIYLHNELERLKELVSQLEQRVAELEQIGKSDRQNDSKPSTLSLKKRG